LNACSPLRNLFKDPVYSTVETEFSAEVIRSLKDRVIVIDPGHGGLYAGAAGRKGLKEKDVNLSVSLLLAEMLDSAGAKVILTRKTDQDFLTPEKDSTARTDLEKRVEISNLAKADLFLSLHHNSSADRKQNSLKTFYKMNEDGPSWNAATFIHKHLVQNLKNTPHELWLGNYFVLRQNKVPAILGEPSYMTHSKQEKRLSDPRRLWIEARSYFNGIAEYFSKGVPRVVWVWPADTALTDNPMVQVQVADDAYGPGLDPAGIELLFNAEKVPFVYDSEKGRITLVFSQPLRNGEHEVKIRIRNLNGNYSQSMQSKFRIERVVTKIDVEVFPDTIPYDQVAVGQLRATVRDRHGFVAAGGADINFQIKNGEILGHSPGQTTRAGQAVRFVRALNTNPIQVKITCGSVSAEKKIYVRMPSFPTLQGFVYDENSHQPVAGASLLMDGQLLTQTDETGYFYYKKSPHLYLSNFKLTKSAYRPIKFEAFSDTKKFKTEYFPLKSLSAGMFVEKRIVIDPEGGGLESGKILDSGIRASDINKMVASYLKEYCEQAGALVFLTRDGDRDATLLQRVEAANQTSADLFVSIRHSFHQDPRNPFYSILYYEQSGRGKKIAKNIFRNFEIYYGTDQEGRIEESIDFVLQQTPCPSVVVDPVYKNYFLDAGEIAEPAWQRKTAYLIFNGIFDFFWSEKMMENDKREYASLRARILDQNKQPVRNAFVQLDENQTLQTDREGSIWFLNVESGSHFLLIQGPGLSGQIQTITIPQVEPIKEFYVQNH